MSDSFDNQPEDQPEGRSTAQKIGIAAIVLLLVGFVGLYVSGVSIRDLLLGPGQESGDKIGVVTKMEGQLKRQPKDSLEFREAHMNGDVFNEDTVLTGQNDAATLTLIDGTVLDLDPGTLIRLSFDMSGGVGGIQRKVMVDVVQGNVKGTAVTSQRVVVRRKEPIPQASTAPVASPTPVETAMPSPSPSPEPSPSPSPSPTKKPNRIQIDSPKDGTILKVRAGSQPPAATQFELRSFDEPAGTFQVAVIDKNGKTVATRLARAQSGKATQVIQFDKPGDYRVEVLTGEGEKIAGNAGVVSKVKVLPEYEGIAPSSPLVGGEPVDSNRYRGKKLSEFDVTLRWDEVPGIKEYRVSVFDRSGKTLMTDRATGGSYAFKKGKLYNEPIFYQVTAQLPSGYLAISPKKEFIFNFLSPELTLPKDGESISIATATNNKRGGILFTWQKTNFTQSYDFEIATEARFTQILKTVNLKENFVIFKNLKPGEYYWRVRSITTTEKSPPGAPFKIVVNP